MQILEAVAGSPDGLSLSEISRLTGLKTTTAHNLVRTMAGGRFLARSGQSASYYLGPAITGMNSQHRGRHLAQIAADHTLLLHQEYPDAVVTFSTAAHGDIQVLPRAWPLNPGTVEHPEGVMMNAHTTVSSLAFQAYWPADQLETYRTRYPCDEYGGSLWPTLKALDRELDAIRKRGFAWAMREPATVLAAAPVFGPGKEIAGVLGIRMDNCRGNRRVLAIKTGEHLINTAAAMKSGLEGARHDADIN